MRSTCAVALMAATTFAAVEFPGPPPGPARMSEKAGVLTLENDVLAMSWQARPEGLRPVRLANKLTGDVFDQAGTELFRLATQAAGARPEGVAVCVRLESTQVVVQVSDDGVAWTELAAFPRAEFPGEPALVRLGKMNLKAQAKNNPGDLGAPGEAHITDVSPAPASLPSGRVDLKTGAHTGIVTEYPFPAGCKILSCRIDKGTDQGMSWGPALALVWEDGQKFLLVGLRDKPATFNITTAAGEVTRAKSLSQYPALDLPASKLRLRAAAKVERLKDRARIQADFGSEGGLRVHWSVELRDDANYIRQTVELESPDRTIPLFGAELMDLRLPEPRTIGTVPGCPVVAGDVFCGVEMPGAQNALHGEVARVGFSCQLALSPDQPYSFSSVIGIAPAGQLRRAFLYYIERERARPSEPFLHYNCWYDLGYTVNASNLFEVVTRFDEELVRKRGVPVQSYLVDDGWDDPGRGLWIEHQGKFPGGFKSLKARMDPLGAHLGIWISPLGGYGGDHQRTAHARAMGLIPTNSAFDLAQPAYKKWFEGRCLQLMREDGVNAFKWDRAGEGVSPHFMALLDIAHNLRKENPKVFINVTVGTWPSPFWLNHVDSTWRHGSADVGWAGKGDDRETWLTFRDGNCRAYFVEKSPLYPLNSVMHHGLVHGCGFQGAKVGKAGPHLKNEARSYFATGASLQELYLTPAMMTTQAWDDVAAAAKWAKARAGVLVDAHWVGGDPLKLEGYGYAAWSPRQGTLMLRNPDDRPQPMTLDARTVFDLPAAAARRYALTSPYADQRIQKLMLEAGKPACITLEPFEVLVFDAAGQ